MNKSVRSEVSFEQNDQPIPIMYVGDVEQLVRENQDCFWVKKSYVKSAWIDFSFHEFKSPWK